MSKKENIVSMVADDAIVDELERPIYEALAQEEERKERERQEREDKKVALAERIIAVTEEQGWPLPDTTPHVVADTSVILHTGNDDSVRRIRRSPDYAVGERETGGRRVAVSAFFETESFYPSEEDIRRGAPPRLVCGRVGFKADGKPSRNSIDFYLREGDGEREGMLMALFYLDKGDGDIAGERIQPGTPKFQEIERIVRKSRRKNR